MDNRPDYIPSQNWLDTERALSVDEAARYLGVSASYLNKLRIVGGSPAFVKAGRRVSYSKSDLDAWRSSRRFGSTAEYAAA